MRFSQAPDDLKGPAKNPYFDISPEISGAFIFGSFSESDFLEEYC
jgi:hypothetical protein